MNDYDEAMYYHDHPDRFGDDEEEGEAPAPKELAVSGPETW